MSQNLFQFAFIALLAFSSSAQAAEIKEIRIATEASYPPFEYLTATGDIQGFNIDIGNEICQRLQAKCIWVNHSFELLIPDLQAGKFDLISSTMTATDARRKAIDFSTPLYVVASRLVASKDKNLFPTAESLSGLRVGVQQGTIMETYARKEWERKGVQVMTYSSYPEVFADLAAGSIDASFQEVPHAIDGFLNRPEGKNFHLTGGTVNTSPILNEPIAIGIPKGRKELKKELDDAIKNMLSDGTIQQLSEKYFQPQTIEFASGH